MSQEDYQRLRPLARDAAHVVIFLFAMGFFVATILTGNLGFTGAGFGLLAVIGIARA